MRALFQLTDKEIEDMDLEELRLERMVHSWAAKKQMTNVFASDRRKHWLEEHPQPFDLDEVREQYKRGEIPQRMFANRCSSYARRKREEKAVEMRRLYALELHNHEKAVTAILDERIDEVKKRNAERKRGPKTRDPRRRASPNNPKGDWREKHQAVRHHKPIAAHNRYWLNMKRKEKSASRAMSKAIPVVTWSYEKLRAAARVAGYYTDETIKVAVARELEITTRSASKLLDTGRLSWGQAMLIGALFEMTPALFCDVFLNGYFKEIAEGRFVAQIDDKDAFRADT